MTKERMTTQDIVKNCTEVKENKLDWKKVYASVYQSVATNKYRVFRQGNTLFWIRIDSPGVAQMFVLNADSYKHLLRNTSDFIQAMHRAHYQTIYGETVDLNLLNFLKRAGHTVDIQPAGTDAKGRPLFKGAIHV
jgi:hypothetical protein